MFLISHVFLRQLKQDDCWCNGEGEKEKLMQPQARNVVVQEKRLRQRVFLSSNTIDAHEMNGREHIKDLKIDEEQ